MGSHSYVRAICKGFFYTPSLPVLFTGCQLKVALFCWSLSHCGAWPAGTWRAESRFNSASNGRLSSVSLAARTACRRSSAASLQATRFPGSNATARCAFDLDRNTLARPDSLTRAACFARSPVDSPAFGFEVVLDIRPRLRSVSPQRRDEKTLAVHQPELYAVKRGRVVRARLGHGPRLRRPEARHDADRGVRVHDIAVGQVQA